jgi:hypothetical protein
MARRLGVLVLVALAGSAAAWGDGQSAAPLRIFLRGIAWAGKRDVDLLATREETEALRD